MSTRELAGRCQCEAVRFAAKVEGQSVGACHCDLCRRWGGGPLFAVDGGADVEFEGEDQITVYDSTPWAQRGFCARCGTHLLIRVNQAGRYIMPAGLFEQGDFVFDHQIFIDRKPAYYGFSNATRDMTGEEVWAEHAKG